MHVALERVGEVAIVAFQGRLDSHSASSVETELVGLIEAGALKLAFDLSGLEYISSAGLRVMLIAAKRLRPIGGRLVLCALPPSVHEVFEISGFLSIMTIVGTRDEALAALA